MSAHAKFLRVVLFATICVGSVSASFAGEGIPWSTDIEGSLRQASATGKPVLMEFTASWCVYCKRMEKTTFVDPAVVARINDQYVAVRVDADEHKELVNDLAIKGLPAILIVSPELKILARIPGFQTPEALMAKIENVPGVGRPPATLVRRKVPAGRPAASVAAAVGQKPRQDLVFEPITEQPGAAQDRRIAAQVVSRPAGELTPQSAAQNFEQKVASAAQADVSGRARLNDAGSRDHTAATPEVPTLGALDADPEEAQFFASFSEKPATVVKPSSQVKNPGESAAGRPMFNGTCLVTAVEERELAAGVSHHQLIYRGNLLYFSSEDCKARFQAHPADYWPVMDGACAISMLDTEQRVEGQLQFAAVFRKRLWVFTTEKNMLEFLRDPGEIVEELQEMNVLDAKF